MKIYRFRSIDALLDKYQELESRTIYFASPDELNDPMEGLRDIVWKGDKIVWKNFFKHYVYCLYVSYLQYRIVQDSVELDIDNIPILGSWGRMPTPQMQVLFADICSRFFNLPNMPEIIEALSHTNHKFRYRELGVCLGSIHHILLAEIEESFIAHGCMFESARFQPPEGLPPVENQLESILELIKQIARGHDNEKINVALQFREEKCNELRIIRQLENPNPTGASWKNFQLVICDFPNIYLKDIERLLYPDWYTACFTKHYHDSSLWGYYAKGHKGACLIFESNGFELYQGVSTNARPTRLAKIKYITKPAKVDFFRSIGRLKYHDIREHWYTDEEGNVSECASHIPHDGDMDSTETVEWENRYSNIFYRDITAKTKHWEHEQEYRLILEDKSGRFDKETGYKLTYDFNSLKGIIFGIKTSDDDRREIVKIIQKKCEKHKRSNFKFYQAYYSHETGDIRKFEIQVDSRL